MAVFLRFLCSFSTVRQAGYFRFSGEASSVLVQQTTPGAGFHVHDALFKFQSLLKTLFLSEYADLDFGIYRILNARRKNIEQFIDADLPAISADLSPPDKIYLNGPHTLAGAENSEPEFLRLMWKGSEEGNGH